MYKMGSIQGYPVYSCDLIEWNDNGFHNDTKNMYVVGGYLYFFGNNIGKIVRGKVVNFDEVRFERLCKSAILREELDKYKKGAFDNASIEKGKEAIEKCANAIKNVAAVAKESVKATSEYEQKSVYEPVEAVAANFNFKELLDNIDNELDRLMNKDYKIKDSF